MKVLAGTARLGGQASRTASSLTRSTSDHGRIGRPSGISRTHPPDRIGLRLELFVLVMDIADPLGVMPLLPVPLQPVSRAAGTWAAGTSG